MRHICNSILGLDRYCNHGRVNGPGWPVLKVRRVSGVTDLTSPGYLPVQDTSSPQYQPSPASFSSMGTAVADDA